MSQASAHGSKPKTVHILARCEPASVPPTPTLDHPPLTRGPDHRSLLAVVGGMPFDLPMPTHGIGLVTPTCGLTRVNRSRQRRRSAGLAL